MNFYVKMKNENTVGKPNLSYYIDKPIRHNMTHKAAKFGQNCDMCSGSNWVLGKDFAFVLDFFANTYEMGSIREVNSKFDGWYELRKHLVQVNSVFHTTKPYDEVLNDLGLSKRE